MTNPLLRSFYITVNVTLAALLNAFPAADADADTASAQRPPAGQVCPGGSFVTGFDKQGNIICGEVSGGDTASADTSAEAMAGASADNCSPECQSAAAAAVAVQSAPPAEPVAQGPSGRAVTAALAIEKIKPWSVPYGTRDVTLEVIGTGFTADSVVVFQGASYVPSVDQTGTRLEVTVATRSLAMGAYALTVSNGPELKATLKKALVVY